MVIALDWLSVSVRAPKDVDMSIFVLAQNIVDLMYLGDFYKRAVCVGSHKFYATVLRIDDISFKLARAVEGAEHKQGIMIEMSSKGLTNYIHYLNEHNLTLSDVLRDLRSATVAGYVVNFPRLDVCMDDICKDAERPLLRMSKIYDAWAQHLFCSRARAIDHTQQLDYKTDDDGLITSGKVCDKRVKGAVGRTIYFGSRKSAVCVRFYDKLIEQQQKGKTVAADITHWVRCEYEFHQERACAVVAMLIDNDWDCFVKQFARCVLGHLRFIVPDDCNRSRCTTCKWWVKFLDNVCHAEHFAIPPKQSSQADKTIKWLRRSVLPSVWAYIATVGTDEFLGEVYEQGRNNIGFKQLQFLSDYANCDCNMDNLSELWNVVMWSALTCKPLPDIISDLERDFNTIQRCRLKRSESFKPSAAIIDKILALGVLQ